MNQVVESLERHEHASHGAHHEPASQAQLAALLVAVLAAGLAVAEQGARQAEIRVQQRSIEAADIWAQFQAKSTRITVARDIAGLAAALNPVADPTALKALAGTLSADVDRYENDPKDGRKALEHHAHDLEHGRDHAMEQTHAYHNGSAAYQLGIVLATASAITRSRWLLLVAAGLGAAGIILSLLGYYAPALGAF